MLYDVLTSYLRILSDENNYNRFKSGLDLDILRCLAFGFSGLADELAKGNDIVLGPEATRKLVSLQARLQQVAVSARNWDSRQEWDSVKSDAEQLQGFLE